MVDNKKIAVVIPTYNTQDHIENVIKGIPGFVDFIISVDDKCPHNTGKTAENYGVKNDKRVIVIYHSINQGVGGAVITGYKKAMELGCDIIVKMDSDDQMDPKYLSELIKPVIDGEAGYSKGNRFVNFQALRSMPKMRLFGNSILSFMLKASSGYWNVMDPTNGYTAINRKVLQKLNLDKLSKRYFLSPTCLLT